VVAIESAPETSRKAAKQPAVPYSVQRLIVAAGSLMMLAWALARVFRYFDTNAPLLGGSFAWAGALMVSIVWKPQRARS
jgi:hypothetical protein